MRLAGSILTFLLVVSAIALGQQSNSSANRVVVQPISVSAGESTITGCLSGHRDQYRLMENNGTMHLLIGKNGALAKYDGQTVELAGYRDNDRDASASSDNGTARGTRFFLVTDVMQASGGCR